MECFEVCLNLNSGNLAMQLLKTVDILRHQEVGPGILEVTVEL